MGSRAPIRVATWHSTCPTCGKGLVTRNGLTSHSIADRANWGGTLAELAVCDPADLNVSTSETGD